MHMYYISLKYKSQLNATILQVKNLFFFVHCNLMLKNSLLQANSLLFTM